MAEEYPTQNDLVLEENKNETVILIHPNNIKIRIVFEGCKFAIYAPSRDSNGVQERRIGRLENEIINEPKVDRGLAFETPNNTEFQYFVGTTFKLNICYNKTHHWSLAVFSPQGMCIGSCLLG
jgi:hypothetical protein